MTNAHIKLEEIYRDALGDMRRSSSLLPHAKWSYIIGYRVTGVSEVIEGEPQNINTVFIFMSNPTTYPDNLADIYERRLDEEDVRGFCEAYLIDAYERFRDVRITPL